MRTSLVALLALAIAWSVPASTVAQAPPSIRDVFRNALPSVAVIRATGSDVSAGTGGVSRFRETGAGVLISADGKVMTAAHVVHAMEQIWSSSSSGTANGGIGSNGIYEALDVVGSLQYVQRREDLHRMTVGLFSRCCGANATMIAMTKYPGSFKDIRCMVAPQPVSLWPFYERITEILGITDRLDEIDREIQRITSFTMDQMSPIPYAKNVRVPTFITQVHDDALTKPSDVQQIFDNIPVKDKKLYWIEGTARRWDGYNYFPRNPKQMIEWFDTHMR